LILAGLVATNTWIVDAHRDGKRFVVRADEKLTAFLELKAAIGGRWPLPRSGTNNCAAFAN
jgi:hypothetical protein